MSRPPSQWVNAEPDPGLPHALLARLAERIPVGTIEEIWLFPTRRIAAGESTVFLVAAFTPQPEQRRVITARYTVTRDRRGTATVSEHLEEHGTAPATAVTRIVSGVLQRMDEEGEQPPRTELIERAAERWWQLVEGLGGPRAVPAADVPNLSVAADEAEVSGVEAAGSGAIDDENEIDYQ